MGKGLPDGGTASAKALPERYDQQVQKGGWAMVAGQNEQGKEEAFTREATNLVMSLTGASLGAEDTSPRPKTGRFLPAFLL